MEVVNLCHQTETESASEYITAREVNNRATVPRFWNGEYVHYVFWGKRLTDIRKRSSHYWKIATSTNTTTEFLY
jgi:hypothetical protein